MLSKNLFQSPGTLKVLSVLDTNLFYFVEYELVVASWFTCTHLFNGIKDVRCRSFTVGTQIQMNI